MVVTHCILYSLAVESKSVALIPLNSDLVEIRPNYPPEMVVDLIAKVITGS